MLSLPLNLSQFSCPCFFPIYPVYILLSGSDGVQDRGVGDMGLHREQSRGKLPWDQLVATWCPFHCTVIPSMSQTTDTR